MAYRINLIQGSSIYPAGIERAHAMTDGYQRMLGLPVSNRTRDTCSQSRKPTRR
jgi:hypothetical protein